MALAAAQVLDVIAARLVPVALSGGRVYTDRFHPMAEGMLPAWRVVADGEDVEPAQIDGVNVHRLAVDAEGYVHALAGVDDAMHNLAAQGLAALFAPPVPYGLQLQRVDREVASTGEASAALIRLRLQALYWVAPAAPETIIT